MKNNFLKNDKIWDLSVSGLRGTRYVAFIWFPGGKEGVFYTKGDGTCLVSSMGGSCSGSRASAVAWSSGLLTVFESAGGSS